MKITSTAFSSNGIIPTRYTCQGNDINPPLAFSDVPAGTESLAILMHDHDAPGGDFAHWLVWNIDPGVSEMREGTIPAGAVEGTNDMGKTGWAGPCPPSGAHRYEFDAYALRSKLSLPASSTKAEFRAALKGIFLAKASVIGLYKKDDKKE